MRNSQTSETTLINIMRNIVKTRGRTRVGIGDDACVTADGIAVSTDAYELGVHFDTDYMTFREIGTRCTCAAVSDMAAIGAEPELILVALGIPKKINSAKIRALYTGIEKACSAMNCEVAGGDIIASGCLFLSMTVTGRTKKPKLRSMARPGHSVYLTGWAGLAETGREVLRLELSRRGYCDAVRRHIEPWPRLEASKTLGPRIHALIDTSDGLVTDASHLSISSGVKITLDPDCLPIHPETRRLCSRLGLDPVEFALSSGEDYELLFTSPSRITPEVKGLPVTRIGRVERGTDLYLDTNGKLAKPRMKGYDHLERR